MLGKVGNMLKNLQQEEKSLFALEKEAKDNKELGKLLKEAKKAITTQKKVLQSIEKEVKKSK